YKQQQQQQRAPSAPLSPRGRGLGRGGGPKPMMTEFILILLGTILVNNFVLVQFLGLCPFMGVSGKLETAMGMSMATTFVLTLASILSYLTYQYILVPFELEFLRTISFILVI